MNSLQDSFSIIFCAYTVVELLGNLIYATKYSWLISRFRTSAVRSKANQKEVYKTAWFLMFAVVILLLKSYCFQYFQYFSWSLLFCLLLKVFIHDKRIELFHLIKKKTRTIPGMVRAWLIYTVNTVLITGHKILIELLVNKIYTFSFVWLMFEIYQSKSWSYFFFSLRKWWKITTWSAT